MSDRRILEVLDYDPAWVAEYECEARALAQAFASAFLRIEKIGGRLNRIAKATNDEGVERDTCYYLVPTRPSNP